MTQITFILAQLKVELQKMVEVENQVVGLYENMDAKKARVVKKEKRIWGPSYKDGCGAGDKVSLRAKIDE